MKKRLISAVFLLCSMACSGNTIPGAEPVAPPQSGDGEETPAATGTLVADGNSAGTYELIKKCGYNGVEAPDQSGCHTGVQHITQSWDDMLGKYVFNFYIHINQDNDRNLPNITDRQRNEIKTDAKSPASMVGQQGETLVLKWKFRLPEGMKTTTNFCHIHQIKGIDNAAGTADVGNPLITFTVRSMSNGKQQFQVIYVPPTSVGTGNDYRAKVDLADFLGQWVSVEERITFGEKGSYEVTITRVSDGRRLVNIPVETKNLWRENTTGMRPKWGVYRSFGAGGSLKSELRDEVLGFADFSIEKVVK